MRKWGWGEKWGGAFRTNEGLDRRQLTNYLAIQITIEGVLLSEWIVRRRRYMVKRKEWSIFAGSIGFLPCQKVL